MIGQDAGKSFAYILGVYLGDGCVTGGRFRLNTIDRDFAEAVKAALNVISPMNVTLSVHDVSKSSKPNWALGIGDHRLCTRLVEDCCGKRIIPAYVFDGARDQKLAFIAGLMDSEGYVGANSNHTNRRYYMGFKSCDVWVPDFIRLLHTVGIVTGKLGVEKPRKPGYKVPTRFAIKMQSWIDSGARFNIARKQSRVEEWASAGAYERRARHPRKLTPETTCTAPA